MKEKILNWVLTLSATVLLTGAALIGFPKYVSYVRMESAKADNQIEKTRELTRAETRKLTDKIECK